MLFELPIGTNKKRAWTYLETIIVLEVQNTSYTIKKRTYLCRRDYLWWPLPIKNRWRSMAHFSGEKVLWSSYQISVNKGLTVGTWRETKSLSKCHAKNWMKIIAVDEKNNKLFTIKNFEQILNKSKYYKITFCRTFNQLRVTYVAIQMYVKHF